MKPLLSTLIPKYFLTCYSTDVTILFMRRAFRRKECAEAMRKGCETDVSAISAAIHDPLSMFRASLTESAPSTRLHGDVIEHIAKATIRSASQIRTRI